MEWLESYLKTYPGGRGKILHIRRKEPAVLFHSRQLCIGRSQRHRRRVNVKAYALEFHAPPERGALVKYM